MSKCSVVRGVEKYRQEDVVGFFQPRKRRGPTLMTAEVMAKAQGLLDPGWPRREVAEELAIKCDTLRKAIEQGSGVQSRVRESIATDPY